MSYGKRAAWRNIGLNCVVYGTVFILFGLFIGAVSGMNHAFTPVELLEQPLYIALLALPVLSVLTFNLLYKDFRDCSVSSELLVAAAVLLGLSIPVTALGIFLIAITMPDYEGVERWLPEVKDRSYYELTELQRAVTELDLSKDVQQRSEQVLEEARDKDLLSGRSFNAVLGGIVYITAREKQEPRTLDEISETVREKKRDVGKAYRYIARELDLRIVPPPPEQYIERFCAKLGLTPEAAIKAREIVERTSEETISGKSSKGIAAASVYIAAFHEGEERSLREISDILNVTTVTVRERGRDIVEDTDVEAPQNLQQ